MRSGARLPIPQIPPTVPIIPVADSRNSGKTVRSRAGRCRVLEEGDFARRGGATLKSHLASLDQTEINVAAKDGSSARLARRPAHKSRASSKRMVNERSASPPDFFALFANLAVKLCNQVPDSDLHTATSRCSQPLRGQHHTDDIVLRSGELRGAARARGGFPADRNHRPFMILLSILHLAATVTAHARRISPNPTIFTQQVWRFRGSSNLAKAERLSVLGNLGAMKPSL